MTTIKINAETLSESVNKASTKALSYQDQVIAASSAISLMNDTLQGAGYDSLLNQIETKVANQKKLVAECVILSEDMVRYCIAMSTAESGANFP